jgi:UDP-glucuronate 4-epimerase
LNDYYDPSIKQENLERLKRFANFTFYQLDICDREEMARIISEHKVESIVHLAARAGVRYSLENPDVYVHSNILGSTVIFDLAGKFKLKHVVYASSSSVYGSNVKVPFKETDCIDNCVSPYAGTKKATETMAAVYSKLFKQVSFTGLRFFTVYGPRGRPDMAPFKFVDRIMRGCPIDKYGTGLSSRDYTYIEDIVDGIVKSLMRPYQQGFEECDHRIYNLGNSSPVSLNEFIALVEKVTGKQALIKQLPDQPGDVDKTFADIGKAQQELGYTPKTSLEKGLKELVKWYRAKYCVEDTFNVPRPSSLPDLDVSGSELISDSASESSDADIGMKNTISTEDFAINTKEIQ